MLTLTPRHHRFNDVFMRRILELLSGFLLNKYDGGEADMGGAVLDSTSTAINTASAGVALVGLAGAAPTLGTSLAAAAACIVILQTGQACSKIVKGYHQGQPYSPDETRYEELSLTLKLLLRDVSFELMMNYSEFIEERLEEKGVNEFAHYGAERVMKLVVKDFNEHKATTLSAKQLVYYLIESIHVSALPGAQRSKTVTAKEKYFPSSVWMPSAVFAKWAYSRARIAAVKTLPDGTLQYVFYGSLKENILIGTDSTLEKYGYRTVDMNELTFTPQPHFHGRRLQQLKLAPSVEQAVIQNFICYYPVTRSQLIDYIKQIRLETKPTHVPLSLNAYLSSMLKVRVIATCHGDITDQAPILQGLDLEGGNFSEVNFCRANLRFCNLKGTMWKEAHIEAAQFEANDLTDASFEQVYAEKSTWTRMIFVGNFSRARMSGSKIMQSTLTSAWQHLGCELDLVELEDVKTEILQQELADRLTQEYNERIQCEHELFALVQSCQACVHQVVTATEVHSALEEQELAALQVRIVALETSQRLSNVQVQVQLVDVKSQVEVLLAASDKTSQRHQEAITEIQRWRESQEERWETLQKNNQLLEHRVVELEHESVFSLFKNLRHTLDGLLSSSSFQDARANYIERDLISLAPGKQNVVSSWDVFEQFMHSDTQQVMVVLGNIFDGKSSTALMWLDELRHGGEWVPFYYKLKQVSAKRHENVLKACFGTNLDNAQITTLMEKIPNRCFIVLDGVEHCDVVLQRSIIEECLQLNPEWKQGVPKFLLISQAQFLFKYNYPVLLQMKTDQPLPMDAVYALVPPSESKNRRYVELYANRHPLFSGRYAGLFTLDPGLKAMVTSPFMLRIICEIALNLAQNNSHFVLRSEFYDVFYDHWNRHAKAKLLIDHIKLDDFSYYVRELSYAMASLGQDWCDIPYKDNRLLSQVVYEDATRARHREPLPCLLEHKLLGKFSYVMPLSMQRVDVNSVQTLRYQFEPKTLGYFPLAQKFLACLFAPNLTFKDKLQVWNGCFLTAMPDVLAFMQNMLLYHPERATAEHYLFDFIAASQGAEGVGNERAASNAISLLNILKCNFSQVVSGSAFSGIHIRKSLLTSALLAQLDMNNSDLSDTYVDQADLSGTDLTGSNLNNMRFWRDVAFMSTETPPHIIAVNQQANLIAFDVDQDSLFRKQGIAVVQISDGYQYTFYTQYMGHQSNISFLTWSTNSVLASGGTTGTIRLWRLTQVVSNQILGRLKGHTAEITSLAWSKDACFLISGSKDNTLQIWDIENQCSVFQSEQGAVPLERVLWGHARTILVTASSHKIEFNFVNLDLCSLDVYHTLASSPLIKSMVLSPDNQKLATGWQNGEIKIQPIADINAVMVLVGHKKAVTVLIWNEQYLVSADQDGAVCLWDADKQACIKTYVYESGIDVMAWLPNQQDLIWIDKSTEPGFCILNTTKEGGAINHPALKVDGCTVTGATGLTVFDELTFKRKGAINIKEDRHRLFSTLNRESASRLTLPELPSFPEIPSLFY